MVRRDALSGVAGEEQGSLITGTLSMEFRMSVRACGVPASGVRVANLLVFQRLIFFSLLIPYSKKY